MTFGVQSHAPTPPGNIDLSRCDAFSPPVCQSHMFNKHFPSNTPQLNCCIWWATSLLASLGRRASRSSYLAHRLFCSSQHLLLLLLLPLPRPTSLATHPHCCSRRP